MYLAIPQLRPFHFTTSIIAFEVNISLYTQCPIVVVTANPLPIKGCEAAQGLRCLLVEGDI